MDSITSRLLSAAFGVLAIGAMSYSTADRNAQLEIRAKNAKIANERIQDQAANQSASPIVDGKPAMILGAGGTPVPAPSDSTVVDYSTGVTSQATPDITVYGTTGPPLHRFVKAGDPVLASNIGKARADLRK
jgi:hypothetical protein